VDERRVLAGSSVLGASLLQLLLLTLLTIALFMTLLFYHFSDDVLEDPSTGLYCHEMERPA